LRTVPNIIAMAPKDEDELVDMMFTATHQKHPVFIRYPRGAAEGVPIKDQPKLLEIGKAEVLQNFSNSGGRKVTFFALGNMQKLAHNAAEQLAAEGCDAALVNPRFTKPLDDGVHEFFGHASEVIVTLEDHVLPGGYGSAVLELFNEKGITTPVVRIGWPDQFVEHATGVDDLRKKYGLTVENAIAKVKEELSCTATKAQPLAATFA
jgi:1-deoxy-D-xylulose-5-phosphate synthase